MNEKYHRIIDAAIKLFIENGIHNTPTSKIAKEANVATGTLFHYFENKEALINAVYLDSKKTLSEALTKGTGNEMDILGTAKMMFENSLKWSVGNPERVRFYQTYGNSGFITETTKERAKEKLEFLYQFIIKGQEQGYIKEVSPELLYNAVYGIMSQMMNYFSSNPGLVEDQKSIENAFTLLWDTMKR